MKPRVADNSPAAGLKPGKISTCNGVLVCGRYKLHDASRFDYQQSEGLGAGPERLKPRKQDDDWIPNLPEFKRGVNY